MVRSCGEGSSSRSERNVNTPKEPSARHSFDGKELKKEDFHENHVDVEGLGNHFGRLQGLVQTQSWEKAFMTTPAKRVVLPKIK